MTRNARRYPESLREGRVVYLGGERVDEVSTPPAFRNAARICAAPVAFIPPVPAGATYP